MSNFYDIKITEKRLVLNLIQMMKMKKKKLSSCANSRLRRKRRLTRNTVDKESVLKSLVSSIKKLSLYPVLLLKVQRLRIRLEVSSKKAFSSATWTKKILTSWLMLWLKFPQQLVKMLLLKENKEILFTSYSKENSTAIKSLTALKLI